MQIKIKQSEIIAAITGYITSQGISLAGKKVEVDFTAGRGDAGLSADITIEDPVAEAAAQPNKPVMVAAPVVATAVAVSEEKVGGIPEAAEAAAEAVPAAPVVAGKSLFAAA